MKIIQLVFALMFSFSVFAKEDPQTVKLKTSAVCGMCKRKIEKNLAYETGIQEVNLDVATKVLTVTFDPKKTSLKTIKKIVSDTGYNADEVAANPASYDKLSGCCKKDVPAHH